jgi:hypothetical protein
MFHANFSQLFLKRTKTIHRSYRWVEFLKMSISGFYAILTLSSCFQVWKHLVSWRNYSEMCVGNSIVYLTFVKLNNSSIASSNEHVLKYTMANAKWSSVLKLKGNHQQVTKEPKNDTNSKYMNKVFIIFGPFQTAKKPEYIRRRAFSRCIIYKIQKFAHHWKVVLLTRMLWFHDFTTHLPVYVYYQPTYMFLSSLISSEV